MSIKEDDQIPAAEQIAYGRGGIPEIAAFVVSKERAGAFVAASLADDTEVWEFLSETMRGNNDDAECKEPLKYRIAAAKMLQDRFIARERIYMSGKPRSLILDMKQPEPAALPSGSAKPVQDEHLLLEARLEAVDSTDEAIEEKALAAASINNSESSDDEDWLNDL